MGFELLGELSPTWIEYKMGTNTLALAVRTKPFDDPAPPTDQAFGHRTLSFLDPNGNVLDRRHLRKFRGNRGEVNFRTFPFWPGIAACAPLNLPGFPSWSGKFERFDGADCRNRTDDLPLTRRVLYQLS